MVAMSRRRRKGRRRGRAGDRNRTVGESAEMEILFAVFLLPQLCLCTFSFQCEIRQIVIMESYLAYSVYVRLACLHRLASPPLYFLIPPHHPQVQWGRTAPGSAAFVVPMNSRLDQEEAWTSYKMFEDLHCQCPRPRGMLRWRTWEAGRPQG